MAERPTTMPLEVTLPQKAADCLHWGNLQGASLAIAVSEIISQRQGPLVILCADQHTALKLEAEITFFSDSQTLAHYSLLHFPDWETLPYDNFSPHQDIVSERLRALYQLQTSNNTILLLTINTACHRLAPPSYVQAQSFVYRKGQSCSLEDIRQTLTAVGYRHVAEVIEHGEFAVRGSILDIYPMGAEQPIRLDFFADELDSIREFDADTQRSIKKIDAIELLPAHEFSLTEAAIDHFRKSWRSAFSGDPTQCLLYEDVSQGLAPPGIEYYLPLFHEKTATLFDYLSAETLVLLVGDLQASLQKFWQEISDRYEQFQHDISKPLLPVKELFLSENEFFHAVNTFQQVRLSTTHLQKSGAKTNYTTSTLPALTMDAKLKQPLQALQSYLASTSARTLICAETAGRREILLNLLQQAAIEPQVYSSWQAFLAGEHRLGLAVAPIDAGVELKTASISLIAEAELFGLRVQQQRRRQRKSAYNHDLIIRNLNELAVNTAVVHLQYGIGLYQGLKTLTVDAVETEFLSLQYADKSMLYVPVSSLHLISRYSGAEAENVQLSKLGSGQWEKAKRKAAEQLRDVAAELLNIHARRAARKGIAFNKPDEAYTLFSNSFPFEETADQQKAINDVLADLISEQPMDRLVCGDVGFGKTEVAMRGAFVVVQSGKQVVVLVPTTLLAQQHYASFQDRFAEWPIKIEVLSRFRSHTQVEKIMADVAAGQIDILIGTHKLLAENIQYNDLGLLIIDEEHRFGVRQKERLKALRSEVDILTLTATPIPRTLNLSISGLRDLSIISTPPQKRLSVKTFVREASKNLVKEAITREIMRGGQVYYLHNDVKTIEQTASMLAELVPEARIQVGHGQMRERQLESIMSDFYHQRFNVLVCTTIIETGIDIPSANTIIIERADKFGLAQLHQLRGRVGRSHHQAYAYLFTPTRKALTANASKRLDAIAATEHLGAGFSLATHDLEIRGAGEVLGEGQSGNIHAIGFSLYSEMLEQAVKSLKAGKEPDLNTVLPSSTEIDCKMAALIPSAYLADVHTRLVLYKRIASCTTVNEINEIKVEMIDRFGPLPQQVNNLFAVTELKLLATPIGVKKISAHSTGGSIEFTANPKINSDKIIELIQRQSQCYQMQGPNKLSFTLDLQEESKRAKEIARLLGSLSLHIS